jgi:hypothetical protein
MPICIGNDTPFLMLMLNWFQDLVKGNISRKDADPHRHDTSFLMLMLNWFQDLS